MLKCWLAAGLVCLLAVPGYSQDPSEKPTQDTPPQDAPTIPSALVDRMFEMAEHDSDSNTRRTALETCSQLPDQQPRFTATIDRMLDSPERVKRFDAVRYLGKVDLPAERKVAAAIRFMRDQYSVAERINYNILPIQPILTQHSEVAIEMIVEHLNNGGDMPVLYLDMADVCGIDIDKFQPLLIEYSNSQDAAVRQRLAQLLSNRFSVRLRELERQQRQAKLSEPTAQSTEEKLLAYSQRIISRYDQDNSGSLQKAEWTKMLMDPSPADANQDGEITVEEYRDYLMKRTR